MLILMLELLDNDEDRLLFSELYEKYLKCMLYAANQILENEHDAEDATQQAFINIANRFSVVKKLAPKQVKSYFITVALNSAKNILRSKKCECLKIADYIENVPSNISVVDEVVDMISTEELANEIGKLPDIYATVLVFSYIYDLSDKQIAKQLCISHNTVRKRKERGKIYLYEKIINKGDNNIEVAI